MLSYKIVGRLATYVLAFGLGIIATIGVQHYSNGLDDYKKPATEETLKECRRDIGNLDSKLELLPGETLPEWSARTALPVGLGSGGMWF